MSSELPLPPGPRGLRELLATVSERRKDPLQFYRSLTRKYGDVVYLRVGKIANVFVTHPDSVQKVLQTNSKNYVKGPGYERLRSFLGQGLLTSEGELWRRQRKLAAPAFHQTQLKLACEDIVAVVKEMMARWDRQLVSKPELDLAAEMNSVALGIVGRTLFSSDSTNRSEDVRMAVQEVLRFSDAGATNWLRIIDTLIPTKEQNLAFRIERHLPLPGVRKFHRSIDVLRGVVSRIIDDRRKSGDYGSDLLGALMKARDEDDGSVMTDAQLRDEVMTILNAGHETTATSLTWAWLMLDRHPEMIERMVQEVKSVLGDRDPGFEDLFKLQFTTRFFEETLRLFPPFWRLSRRALQDDELQGYRIPKGAVVVVSPFLTHRDPRFWSDPEKFDPDRFAPETLGSRHRFSYVPFGGGGRVCIGSNFALVEGLAILAMVVRRYKFQVKPGYRPDAEATITIRPRYGLPVTFSRREGSPT